MNFLVKEQPNIHVYVKTRLLSMFITLIALGSGSTKVYLYFTYKYV